MNDDVGADLFPVSERAWRRHYLLFVLCLVGVFNMLDRQIISVLLEPIKKEFGASDAAMGVVVGAMFAGFYLVAAVPVGRLADRYPRKWVIGICLGFWSMMTALAGATTSLAQLGATRIGVAVAEAATSPASYSMLSDVYRTRVRATVISILAAAQAAGIGLGVFLGGWLSDVFTWRISLMLVGAPGILLAVWMLLTVREPVRGSSDRVTDTGQAPSTRASLAILWRIPTYRCLMLTAAFAGFGGYGVLNWGPTFLRRLHQMSGAEVGTLFGSAVGLSLMLGNIVGGIISDRLGRRDMRAYMWIAAAGPLLSTPAGFVFVFASDGAVAIVALFLFLFFQTSYIPPCYAVGQMLAPLRVRAMASVGIAMATGVAGMFLAPLAVGLMNDAFSGRFGDGSIRYSLGAIIASAALAAAAATMGSRMILRDYAATRQADSVTPQGPSAAAV